MTVWMDVATLVTVCLSSTVAVAKLVRARVVCYIKSCVTLLVYPVLPVGVFISHSLREAVVEMSLNMIQVRDCGTR